MEWERPTQRVLDAFEEIAPPRPVERKKMFGMPACFVNGNVFFGLFGDCIILRVGEAGREKLIDAGGEPFAPMGRTMREYVSVTARSIDDGAALRTWVEKAQTYAEPLAAKQPKARKHADGRTTR